MKRVWLALLLLVVLLVTGCWNYRELNDMAIIGAIGIDYNEEKNSFITSTQIFNAKKQASSDSVGSEQSSLITFYENEAKTVHEGLRNIIYQSPKKVYAGHLDIIAFGEKFAQIHLENGLDLIFRDEESRKDFEVILVKDGTASELLKVLTPLENIPSISIKDSLNTTAFNKGATVTVGYDEFLSYLYGEGVEAFIPVIKIKGDTKNADNEKNISTSDPDTRLEVKGIGLFKDKKLIGYLGEKESIGFSFLTNRITSTVISFECDNKGVYAAIELVKSKTKMKANIDNDIPKFNIDLSVEAFLSEYDCSGDLRDIKVLDKIEDKATKEIKKIIEKSLTAVQKEYKTDVVGFGNYLYRNHYKYWKKNKKKWDEIYPNLEYDIKINLKMTKKGSTVSSFKGG